MFPALSQLLTNAIRSLMYLMPCADGRPASCRPASCVVSTLVSYRDDDDYIPWSSMLARDCQKVAPHHYRTSETPTPTNNRHNTTRTTGNR
jgi:hypothetical protein